MTTQLRVSTSSKKRMTTSSYENFNVDVKFLTMPFVAKLLLLMSFHLSAQAVPIFEFIGDSSKEEFARSYDRAFNRLSSFYKKNTWSKSIDLSRLIKRVEVYASKEDFDKKLIQLSEGKMNSIPKTYVGVADKNVLRVVAWPAYRKIHSKDSKLDYEKLLTHEIAHQLHIAFLSGDENLMGPVWFFEGLAVVAADQYGTFKVDDREQIKAIVSNPERGDYKSYGAILRKLVKSKSLSDLIEMAKSTDFNSKIIEILK